MLRTVRHYIIVAVLGRLGRPSVIAVVEQECTIGRDGFSAVDVMELQYLDVPKETGQAELAAIIDNLRVHLTPGDNSSDRVEVVLDVTESGLSILDCMDKGRYPLVVTVANGTADEVPSSPGQGGLGSPAWGWPASLPARWAAGGS